MPKLPKSFSARVRARMAAAGIRPPKLRAELASRGLEVSRSAVHNWVSGSSAPGLGHALVILDLLAVPRSEQLSWIDALAGMPDRGRDVPAPATQATDVELADQLRRRAGVAFEAGDDELAAALREDWRSNWIRIKIERGKALTQQRRATSDRAKEAVLKAARAASHDSAERAAGQ